MKKSQKKFLNRVINRIYKHIPSDSLRLFLLNLCTRLIDGQNRITHDKANNLYWLNKGATSIFAVEKPYFDFEKEKIDTSYKEIFCNYYQPREGDVILDLGAGIGEELNYFMENIKSAGVYHGIEASPKSFKKLQLLKNRNEFKNCFLYNIAISDKDGKIWIEEDDNYLLSKINNQSKGANIQSYTLDSFIKNNNISKINFLKVNIEGAEYEMIDGMKEGVAIIDNIAVSCHDFLTETKEEKIKIKVEDFLRENDFQLFYEDTGNKVLDSWIYGKKKVRDM